MTGAAEPVCQALTTCVNALGRHHPQCPAFRQAPKPLEPFADRQEQAAAEDAMRATLPTGHPEALVPCDCALRGHGLHRLGCSNRERPSLCFDYPQDARAVPAGGGATSDRPQIPEAGTSPGGEVVGGATPATDRDTVRQRIADELGRHQGLRGPMDDERPDVWQNRCECGWDDGDEHPGWRERYRLHIADAVMAEVVDPLLATIARVQQMADDLAKWAGTHDDQASATARRIAEELRRTLDARP